MRKGGPAACTESVWVAPGVVQLWYNSPRCTLLQPPELQTAVHGINITSPSFQTRHNHGLCLLCYSVAAIHECHTHATTCLKILLDTWQEIRLCSAAGHAKILQALVTHEGGGGCDARTSSHPHLGHGAGDYAARGAPPPPQQRGIISGQRQGRERRPQHHLSLGHLSHRPCRAQRCAVRWQRSLLLKRQPCTLLLVSALLLPCSSACVVSACPNSLAGVGLCRLLFCMMHGAGIGRPHNTL